MGSPDRGAVWTTLAPMADLLSPVSSRTRRPPRRPAPGNAGDADTRRPLVLGAALAGIASPAVALLLLWAIGLVGWFAADGGSHGTTRSVLRLATDTWLLAHGADLAVKGAVVTATPLGLTLLCGWLTYRAGRWAGATSAPEELRGVGMATVVVAGVYGVVALLAAVLASAPSASPSIAGSFLGGSLLAAVAGGAGLLRGSGRAGELRRRVPVALLAVLHGAATVVLAMAALGALLVAVALVFRGPAAIGVLEALDADLAGGLMMLLLLAGIAPNLSLLADGYLLGPGFAVGTGTVVSPQDVVTGPVPSVPVLAALPENGWTPGWVMAVLAVPVLVGAVAGFLTARTHPTHRWADGAWRALGAGALGSLLLAVAASAAGGAIGPGRMADIGVAFLGTFLAALLAIAPAAALGGLLGTWWVRRRDLPEAEHPVQVVRDVELTVPVPVPVPVVPTARRHSAKPEEPEHDLSTEDTVAVRVDQLREDVRGSTARRLRRWLGDEDA